jgi:hypothetical protein
MKMYKNSLHMFTALNSGLKIPFALDKFTTALPVTASPTGGTILYGVGIPAGIQIQEPVAQVTELYNEWFKNNAVGAAGRV